MSNVFYPLSLIAAQRMTPFNRVVADEFEAGNTSTRLVWPEKTFKRQFVIEHGPLTLQEYAALRGFAIQRSGSHDYFWYRDNILRAGNAKVRFASAFPVNAARQVIQANVQLDEVAPVRMLPDIDEVAAAAGAMPLVWYDANRVRYFEHPVAGVQTAYYDTDGLYDHSPNRYHAAIQAGTNPLSNILGQWQWFRGDGTAWAQSPTLPLSAGQPALSAFCIARHSAAADGQYTLFSIGALSASNDCIGISLNGTTTDQYYVHRGTAADGNAIGNNSPVDTWRSLAFSVPASSNTVERWMNAVSPGPNTVTRAYKVGPLTIHALSTGAEKMNNGAGMTNADLAHVLVWASTRTTAQIQALHNLFRHQFGMAAA